MSINHSASFFYGFTIDLDKIMKLLKFEEATHDSDDVVAFFEEKGLYAQLMGDFWSGDLFIGVSATPIRECGDCSAAYVETKIDKKLKAKIKRLAKRYGVEFGWMVSTTCS